MSIITKTCLNNIDLLKPHFFYSKTGIYSGGRGGGGGGGVHYFSNFHSRNIDFSNFHSRNIDCGYLLEAVLTSTTFFIVKLGFTGGGGGYIIFLISTQKT